MTEIVFNPWVGSKFNAPDNSVRLLVVGESHYGEPVEQATQATSTVVENWRSGVWNVRYLIAAARLLTGKERRTLDRVNDLNYIAFYNFIQVAMQKCGVRPTRDQGLASQNAFREVLGLLNPTHVLITGKFTYDSLPDFDGGCGKFQVGDRFREIGAYKTSRGKALATPIPHLSRAFSPPQWRPVVQKFISLDGIPSIAL